MTRRLAALSLALALALALGTTLLQAQDSIADRGATARFPGIRQLIAGDCGAGDAGLRNLLDATGRGARGCLPRSGGSACWRPGQRESLRCDFF